MSVSQAAKLLRMAENLRDIPAFLLTPGNVAAIATKMGFALNERHVTELHSMVKQFVEDKRPTEVVLEDESFTAPFYALLEEASTIMLTCPHCGYSAPSPTGVETVMCPSCNTRIPAGI
jgi:rubrerythrin